MRPASSSRPVATVLALVVGLGLGACGSGSGPEVHGVAIDASSYSPSSLDVEVGDTVVWTNRDLLVHTVTGKSGELDSGDIPPGESWRYEVETPEDLEYFCVHHPTMEGDLRIGESRPEPSDDPAPTTRSRAEPGSGSR